MYNNIFFHITHHVSFDDLTGMPKRHLDGPSKRDRKIATSADRATLYATGGSGASLDTVKTSPPGEIIQIRDSKWGWIWMNMVHVGMNMDEYGGFLK